MKVIIAPDSFKGSMSVNVVTRAMERGIKRVDPSCETIKVPLADGGEGTVDALLSAEEGVREACGVTGPVAEQVDAYYAVIGDTAVIEVAAAVGFHLLEKQEGKPLIATTYGVGELILHALAKGIRNFVIGLGGSVTNDGGIGMVEALGVRVLDENGEPVGYGASGLLAVDVINVDGIDKRLKECTFQIATDVDNVLVGKSGATYIYGPQKGVERAMLPVIDAGMTRYAELVKRDIGVDVAHVPGAGAAGGLGAACIAFLGARLTRGIDIVTDLTALESHISQADLVLTGEGKIDGQTLHGKVLTGVARVAKKHKVPVIALAGVVDWTEDVQALGMDGLFSIACDAVSVAEAIERAEELTERLVERVFRDFLKKNSF